MKKDKLFKKNILPLTLSVDRDVVEYCVHTYVTPAAPQLAPIATAHPHLHMNLCVSFCLVLFLSQKGRNKRDMKCVAVRDNELFLFKC